LTDGGPGARDTLVIFDGACDLCSGAARFISRRDRRRRFSLVDAGSGRGRELLARHGLDGNRLETLVLIEGARAYTRSDAALRIARGLGWPRRAAFILAIVPGPFRDFVYDAVARNRYCLVPGAAQRLQMRR